MINLASTPTAELVSLLNGLLESSRGRQLAMPAALFVADVMQELHERNVHVR